MKHLDAEVRRKVNQWLKFADEDLQLAERGLKLKRNVPYRLIAYHAQQCAEKSCSKSDYSGSVENITIGAPPLEQNALIYIADDQGYSPVMA